MRKLAAILLGKAILKTSRVLKTGGGSAAPGLYSLKIYPGLIEELIRKIPKNIIVTGTNGKTTTAQIIAHLATKDGLKVIRNNTGSNLERGIASALLSSLRLHLRGAKLNFDLGVWEVDEAAFNTLATKIRPDIIIFTNAYRDQLDRYGEVDSVVRKWGETLKNLDPETTVLINGDDPNTVKLKDFHTGKKYFFGVEKSGIRGEGKLTKKIKLDFKAKDIKLIDLQATTFAVHLGGGLNQHLGTFNAKLSLPGIYNIYNALAAIACGYFLNLTPKQLFNNLNGFSTAFGRAEKFDFGYILLIKNPTGATEVFKMISPALTEKDRLLIALNDNFADGTDVSWIWDAAFEQLSSLRAKRGNLDNVIASGTRAYDLAVRLKYAGIDTKQLMIEPNIAKALQASCDNLKGTLYVLPTYTAMLQLQRILADSGIKKHYWEEDN